MRPKLRIGKDFGLTWTIKAKLGAEEAPYTPSGNTVLLLVTPYNKVKAEGATFDGNTVNWIFRGKNQKRTGIYGLELVENWGEDGMVTIDTCDAFELVEHTCEETGNADNGVIFETLKFITDVELTQLRGPEGPQGPQGPAGPPGSGGGESYDDTELRGMIAKQDTKLTELSAEIGKKQGTISDLATIRSGAALGATALQGDDADGELSEPDSNYYTKEEVNNIIASAITKTLNTPV